MKIKTFYDGLRNLVANLGTSRDKASSASYYVPEIDVATVIAMYRTSWLARKIINIPAYDSLRKWRAWQAERAQIEAIENEEKRLNVRGVLLKAMIKGRLFGGGAVLIGTGDADPEKPLNVDSISKGGLRYLSVLSRYELSEEETVFDITSPYFGTAEFYRLSSNTGVVQRIHASRLVLFKGEERADNLMASDCWGDSVLQSCNTAIKNADATAANVASLVYEAKIDVIGIPRLMELVSDPVTEAQILRRFELAATCKGNNGALLLDAEEIYNQKQMNFASLTDVLATFTQIVAGAADIPATRLVGQSPKGMNSTGESDMRNYYDNIGSMQELVVAPAIATLDRAVLRSAIGATPSEIFYNWNSLWQTTDKERADIGKITSETIKTVSETRLIPEDVMSKLAVNMLSENGVAPGIDVMMDEYETMGGANSDESAPPIEEDAAALAVRDIAPRTLYVQRPIANAKQIVKWMKESGLADILGEGAASEESLHVTIMHSREPVDWSKAGETYGQNARGEIEIQPGGVRVLEVFEGGAVVLHFVSSSLAWRHEELKEIGAVHGYAEYLPHITLGYTIPAEREQLVKANLRSIEAYHGAIVLGPEKFSELEG